MRKIYIHSKQSKTIENIVNNKRKEIAYIINDYFKYQIFKDALDVGTTSDNNYKHSNYIIKNLKNIKIFKSLSNQKIKSNFFFYVLCKSITKKFSKYEIKKLSSDIVISNATIEHVGNTSNQVKMISNIILLTKKKFVICTPNRFHPIDFHTKIPIIHWLPKKIHRKILFLLGYNFFALEKNLNLLSLKDIKSILNNFNQIKYEIKKIKFLGFTSNYIIFGHKINYKN